MPQDTRGYTPCHVAAQYGHTSCIYHFKARARCVCGAVTVRCAGCDSVHDPRLANDINFAMSHAASQVRWDADVESLDSDGRSALHWAAYKGFADTIRLLLFMDADLMRADREVRLLLPRPHLRRRALLPPVAPAAGARAAPACPSGSRRARRQIRRALSAPRLRAGVHAAALGCHQGQRRGCVPPHPGSPARARPLRNALFAEPRLCLSKPDSPSLLRWRSPTPQAGGIAALSASDNTGSTPAQLAQDKKHIMLAGRVLGSPLPPLSSHRRTALPPRECPVGGPSELSVPRVPRSPSGTSPTRCGASSARRAPSRRSRSVA